MDPIISLPHPVPPEDIVCDGGGAPAEGGQQGDSGGEGLGRLAARLRRSSRPSRSTLHTVKITKES